MKKTKTPSYNFSTEEIKRDLLRETRALRIHSGYADIIIEKVLKELDEYKSAHPVVTEKDVETLVYRELKKYHKDLAYIYHNRDKII